MPAPSAIAKPRNSRLDLLRGIFLIIMAIDHLPPNWIAGITYEFFGFVTAMEGFIFLSGLTCGMVYAGSNSRPRIWVRCWLIYRWYFCLTVILWLAAVQWPAVTRPAWEPLMTRYYQAPGQAVLLSLSLFYEIAHVSILQMYLVFLAPLPWLLGAMKSGRATWVLAGSAALWSGAQFGLDLPRPAPDLLFRSFNLLAWQFLFIAGAAIGYARSAQVEFRIVRQKYVLGVCLAAAAVLFLLKHQGGFLPSVPHLLPYGSWPVNKEHLGPVRLLNTSVLIVLIAAVPGSFDRRMLVSRFWRLPYQAIAFLGRHSLQVFSWHVLVSYLALLWMNSLNALPRLWQTGVVAGVVATLFAVAWLHSRTQRPASVGATR